MKKSKIYEIIMWIFFGMTMCVVILKAFWEMLPFTTTHEAPTVLLAIGVIVFIIGFVFRIMWGAEEEYENEDIRQRTLPNKNFWKF